ncbi:uncharacterized protein UTRI_02570 [Ustilago trichophora]|uniref:DNA 3'-5' helicase n=1 Tax=Ustilago trichophora TaxID=86804 RepID=A0A5C3E6F3_9BASI|nr:uncharacterized protein UTRI_02570 [Ustilago trichophora]
MSQQSAHRASVGACTNLNVNISQIPLAELQAADAFGSPSPLAITTSPIINNNTNTKSPTTSPINITSFSNTPVATINTTSPIQTASTVGNAASVHDSTTTHDVIELISSSPAPPTPNQVAHAVPANPILAASLHRLNLRVIHHPALLVCTRSDCPEERVPLVPEVPSIIDHLKMHHKLRQSGAVREPKEADVLPAPAKQELEATLAALNLDYPSAVRISSDLLPANIIEELKVYYDGYRCGHCDYAVMARSSWYEHRRTHGHLKGIHPVPVQLIYQCGTNRRYLHVKNPKLAPPAPATFSLDPKEGKLDAAAQDRVDAILAKDAELMANAKVTPDGVQPKTVIGNISPWLKELSWHAYWAGKPVVAIGSLDKDPMRWLSEHAAFYAWILHLTKQSALKWMNSLLQAGRQVQQTFRATDGAPSHPYNLDAHTVKRRADRWARLFAVLVHVMMDGDDLDYYGEGDPLIPKTEQDLQGPHLGVNQEFKDIIYGLLEYFKSVSKDDFDKDLYVFEDTTIVSKATQEIFNACHLLITQLPDEVGGAGSLPLVRAFLHLCLTPHGTAAAVNVATSELVTIEFAARAIEHHYLLDPEDGAVIHMPTLEASNCIQAHLQRYLHHNSCSASGYLQSLLRYGMVLAQDDRTNLRFIWTPRRNMVTFGNKQVTVTGLQHLVAETLDRAGKLLQHLLLEDSTEFLELTNLSTYRDDFNNALPGYSFANESELKAGAHCLHQAALGKHPHGQPLMDANATSPTFKRLAAKKYFHVHDEYTKLLTVLIELTSGLPARGSELMQLQHTNTLAGQRNLFLCHGHFVTTLISKKGSGRPKLIPRFLPHAVGQLVLYYIMEVAPFVHLLFNSVFHPREATPMLLVNHAGKPWETTDISKTLQGLCLEFIGTEACELNIRLWRQLSVSIDRELIRPELPAEEYEDHAHDLQAGHTSSTAERHYGLDASLLHQLTQPSIDAMLLVSKRWHQFWGLSSRFQDPVLPFTELASTVAEVQRHNTCGAMKHSLEELKEDVRHIRRKLDHHLFPAFGNPTKLSTRTSQLEANVSKALFKVTGSHCTKTLEQAHALNAIHRKQSPLIVIMATGSGKSALFMAPIFWLSPTAVVVVVVPFIALTQDLVEQCRARGITTSRWNGYRCAEKVEGSQLVFVAAEICYGEAFCNWARDLDQQGRLAAIFFDECHVCLTQSSFRNAMDQIKSLITTVCVPQYFLTATLPPSLVNDFKAKLNLPEDGTGMIRAATNRKNISYSVQLFASMKDVYKSIPQLLTTYKYGAVMVICLTKGLAQASAEELGCRAIWSEMEEKDKEQILSAWLQCSPTEEINTRRVLVGTSAIGTGINPQHVRLVVHAGGAWDMISYVQESGRAGRDGEAASAILLSTHSKNFDAHVKQYEAEENCRRLYISGYMDGMPITCVSQPDFAFCDLCQKRVGGTTTPPKKVVPLDSPPHSDKAPRCYSSKVSTSHQQVASSSCNQDTASAQPSPTPKSRQHTVFATALDVLHSQQTKTQSMAPPTPWQLPQPTQPRLSSPSAAVSIPTPSQQAPASNTIISLLHTLSNQCSLCYLFRNKHICEGNHCFQDCGCWDLLAEHMDLAALGPINASYIGRLKKATLGRKTKGIACYSCLVPIRVCTDNSPSLMSGCSCRYGDIVLPVVAAVLLSHDLLAKVHRLLQVPQLDPSNQDISWVQISLCTAVIYQGQRVLLAFAIFVSAMDAMSLFG